MTPAAAKCVVWDLDNTLWDGILAERDEVVIRPEMAVIVRTLDERGILQSVASRNDAADALRVLERERLLEYFLYPQIHWGAKSTSVRAIARALDLAPDSFLFVDDDPFERDEVARELPSIRTADPGELPALASSALLLPIVTADARLRRQRYMAEARRAEAEGAFEGPTEAFLAELGLSLTVRAATAADLLRLMELTERTHQLNTTGRTYSYDELARLVDAGDHALLVASLEDRYGGYGQIGLVLLATAPACWTIKLLLLSCRVINRGIGPVLLAGLRRSAAMHAVALRADFVPTDRNRPMLVTLRLAGFRERGRDGDRMVLEADPVAAPPVPDGIRVSWSWTPSSGALRPRRDDPACV